MDDVQATPVPPPPSSPQSPFSRLRAWSVRVRLTRHLAVALTIAALVFGMATGAVLMKSGPAGPSATTVLVLLNLDLSVLLMLGVLIARRITLVWAERRRGGAGSRLHVRFVVLFSGMAVAPAILVAVFSILFFNIGLESWFSARVRTALDESLTVAVAYLEEHKEAIAGDVKAMAVRLSTAYDEALRDPAALTTILASEASLRGLTEAVVFDSGGRVLARTGFTFALHFEQVPFWALERANSGHVAVLTSDNDDRVRALVKLDGPEDYYLYAGRFVDARVVGHTQRTQKAVQQYQNLEVRKSSIQITFSLIFIVVALLLLLAAVWSGLIMASRLAKPVMALIDAAERVRSGDLTTQVRERPTDDELASLTRSFNRMMMQIAAQQGALLTANRELDERRRFTETVLAGVSAGVIGLDIEGNIHLPNPSASELLECDLEQRIGLPLLDLWPALGDLMASVWARPDRLAESEIHLMGTARARTLMVRMGAERLDSEVIGFVVTFDDITALQAAQRKAVWADVARRIAHEIKNPLTPIQLSAERLKRKYLKEITSDRDTFVTCTDTIVRQVDDIRRMVDEFSEFARMPTPVLSEENLGVLVRRAVSLQQTAFPAITFDVVLPEAPVKQLCDARQIGQVLTNLLKNAVEAIHGRNKDGDGEGESLDLPPGHIFVRVENDATHNIIRVEDNGIGLPVENRDRLTEPYMTTRVKGTGLGLAIVKKIIEDHGGDLILEDRVGGGAMVALIFPRKGGTITALPVEQGAPAAASQESLSIHGT
ncbi:MAG: PAS domain-containing sensor histidine kinase [Alphaproteobacteria bacterium]|nr:PAS domain-containing sensor histidine kinase [Alphaproteobacteria bacterium]